MRINFQNDRYVFWPIWFSIGRHSARPFTWHWFQIGFEPGPTGSGCMPGIRRVMGQVLHLWRVRVVFGRRADEAG